jgi:predicted nucleotidyltransferase
VIGPAKIAAMNRSRAMIRPELEVSQAQIADFCRHYHIRWMAVFGSALRDDFGPESDVDVLVEFEPGHDLGLAFFALPDEFSSLVGGRQVDMMTVDELNRWIRNRVLREAQVLYDAA